MRDDVNDIIQDARGAASAANDQVLAALMGSVDDLLPIVEAADAFMKAVRGLEEGGVSRIQAVNTVQGILLAYVWPE